MSQFEVSIEDLSALVSELSGLASELEQAGNVTPNTAAAGNSRVEASMQSFFSNWTEGMGLIRHNLSLLTGAVASASAGYEKTDNAIASEFGHA